MSSLIVYDSNFGNTKMLAEAMAEVIGALAISVKDVHDEMLNELELLVVGSPINGWRPTESIGTWLSGLPRERLKGIKVAAFDTRITLPIHGDAAKKIAHGLTLAGATLIAEPEAFIVKGTKGPLNDGELERGQSWAKQLRQYVG